MNNNKPYDISKQMVWLVYKRVRANRGSEGIDNISFEKYEEYLKGNLYILWN